MAILGCVTAGILACVGGSHNTLEQRWAALFTPIILFPSAFLFFCSPSLMFSIWVGGGRVRHVFMDRYVLSDLPVADFERMAVRTGNRGMAYRRYGFSSADVDRTMSGGWGPVLYFKHGRRIRFVGAHMGILQALKGALEAARGSAVRR